MILQASNGCFLTQSEEVSIKERRFEKSMLASSIEEASKWKEIPESEKEKIISEAELFNSESVDYKYLNKVNSLLSTISSKINESGMTATQSLEMKKYYPEWKDILGTEVFNGFRFDYEGTLLEVVTPHILSEEKNPSQQPMMLNTIPSDSESQTTQYYKLVESQTDTDEESNENSLQSYGN